MLVGFHPFDSMDSVEQIMNQLKHPQQILMTDDDRWHELLIEAQDLIEQLLEACSDKRPRISQLL